RLFVAGGRDPEMTEAKDRDIAGINKMAARMRRIRRRDERQAHQQRHVRTWLSLDETTGFLSGQFTAMDWHTVTTALDHRADQIPTDTGSREQRRADALVAFARDWLDGVEPAGQSHVVSVMVDASEAANTGAETGVRLTGGPRIGPDTLDSLLCEGAVEVMVDRHSGMPLAVGPTTRVVPPKLRRYILGRDGGCTIGGCTSSYRLEVHHITPRSQGGTHDAENLTTVCWYHHHIAIHRNGCAIDPQSPPHNRRIIPQPDW
ncbi:MAG: HNH endonuclease, partial [Acidimicrobiia bacterium]|nr:HNH endonuclease [Acidimicrobiia bacterium]